MLRTFTRIIRKFGIAQSTCTSNPLDRLAARADGWSEGGPQNLSTLPTDLLADGAEGAHVHEFAGRAHEHGREVEGETWIWACRRRIAVSLQTTCFRFICRDCQYQQEIYFSLNNISFNKCLK